MDLTKLSEQDLQALAAGDFSSMSDYGLQYVATGGAGVERTWGEALTDIPKQFLSGIGSLGESVGALGELTIGAGQGLRDTSGALREWAEDRFSPAYQYKKAEQQQQIARATEEGGEWAGAWEAFKSTITDPSLLFGYGVETLPSLFAGGAGGLATRQAAKMFLTQASGKALASAGVGGMIGANAAIHAGDVGGETYERVLEAALSQGMDPQQAERIAVGEAQKAALSAAAVSAGVQFLPGGRTIERAVFPDRAVQNVLGDAAAGTFKGAVRGAAGETFTEGVEEGSGQVFSNIGVQAVDPTQTWYEGAGGAAGMGAAVGGLFGGTAGAVSGRRDVAMQQAERQRVEAEEAQRREVEELEARRRAIAQEGLPEGGLPLEGAEGAFPRPSTEATTQPVEATRAAELRRRAEAEAQRRNSMAEGRRPRSWTADEVMQEERSSVLEEVRRLEAERDRRMAAGDAAGAGEMQKRIVAGYELYSDLGGLAPKAAENNAKAIESTRKKLEKLERDLKDADTPQKVEKVVKDIDDNRKKLAELEAQRAVLEEAQAPEGQMDLPFDGAAAVAAARPGTPAGDVLTAEDLKPLGRGRALRDLEGVDLSTVEGLQHAREVIEALPPVSNRETNAAREAMLQEIARREQAQQSQPEAEAPPVETEAVQGSLAAELAPGEQGVLPLEGGEGVFPRAQSTPVVEDAPAEPVAGEQIPMFGPRGGVTPAARRTAPARRAQDEAIDQTVREAAVPGREGAHAERPAVESGVGVASEPAQPDAAPRGEAPVQTGVARGRRPAGRKPQGAGAQPRALTEAQDAVQKQETAPVPAQPEAGARRRVGREVPAQEAATRESEAPRQAQEAEPEAVTGAPRTLEERIADLEERIAGLDARIADSLDTREQNRLERERDVLEEQLRKLNRERLARSRLSDTDLRAEERDAVQAAEEGVDVEAQVEPEEGDDRRASGTTAPEAEGQPAAELEGKLRTAFNNPAAFRNRVTIVQSVNDLPADIKRSFDEAEAQGFVPAAMFDGNTNRVYMVADRVPAGKELGVFLHETGVHMGMENLLGPDLYKSLLAQIDKWAKDGKGEEGRLARLAAERAGQNAEAGFQANDEALAYFVEEAVNAGINPTALKGNSPLVNWFRRMMGAIRSVLRGLGLRPTAYDAQDVVDLAYGGADLALRGAEVADAGATEARKFSGQSAGDRILAEAGYTPPAAPATLEERLKEIASGHTPAKVLAKRLFNRVMQALDVQWGYRTARDEFYEAMGDSSVETLVGDGLLTQMGREDAVAAHAIQTGGLTFDAKNTGMFTSVDGEYNFANIGKVRVEMAKNHGLTEAQVNTYEQQALIGRRLLALVDEREAALKRADALDAAGKPGGRREAVRLRRKWENFRFPGGRDPAQTRAYASKLVQLFDVYPELKKIEEQKNGIRGWVVKALVDSGLWTEDQATAMLENAEWVPFRREFSEDEQLSMEQYASRFGAAQISQGFKEMKGSEREVVDVMENFQKWALSSLVHAMRNKMHSVLIQEAEKAGFAQPSNTGAAPGQENRVVRYYDKGQPRYTIFDNPIEAAMFQTNVMTPGVSAVIRTFNKWFRNSIVAVPTFAAKQLVVDVQEAIRRGGLPPEYAHKVIANTTKQMASLVRKEETTAYKELRARGLVGPDADLAVLRAEDLRLATDVDGVTAKSRTQIGRLWEEMRNKGLRAAMYSDNAVRLGLYVTALEAGMSQAQATKLASDYINFRRAAGSSTLRAAAAYVPFFGAAVAALRATLTALSGKGLAGGQSKKEVWKNLGQNAAMLSALSVLFAMANQDDEDYQNASIEQRARQFTIPGTGGFGIPRRVTIETLPEIMAEIAFNQVIGQAADSTAASRAMGALATEALIPVPEPMPAPIKTLIEQLTDYNFFTGERLVGRSLSDRESYLQYGQSTSELAKFIGEATKAAGLGEGLSPVRVDHAIRGTFGIVGAMVLMATNSIAVATGARPASSMKDVLASVPGFSFPMAKDFNNADRTLIYDMIQRVDTVVKTANALKAAGRVDDYREYVEENRALMAQGSAMRQISAQLGKIRRAVNQVIENDKLSAAQKRAEIQRLKDIEARLLKNLEVTKRREAAGL